MKEGTLRSASFWPVLKPVEKASADYKELHQQLLQAATEVVKGKPQTIIMMSQYQYMLPDAIGYSPQARLEGHYEVSDGPTIKVGLETDAKLSQQILREGERFGIPFMNILDHMPSLGMQDYFLHESATIPLWYLQQAGLKQAQIVRLTMGALSYEELYTAGKVVQLAVQKSGRRVAVLGASNLLQTHLVNGVNRHVDMNLQIMAALGDQSLALLQEIGYPQEFTLRTAAFVLGTVSGLSMKVDAHTYQEIGLEAFGMVQYHR